MILRYLIEKEFRQLRRNTFLPRLILLFPCMIMLVFPWAATMEVDNLRIAVIDNDRTPSSERLVHRIEASRYFKLTGFPETYDKGLEAVERDKADVLLEIPRGFEKDQANGRPASALVAVNAVNGMKGALGNSYLTQILSSSASASAGSVRYWFNPHLDYKIFMVPALMTMILVLLCGFLPALNVVSEKETGTIEQINVTPVSRFTFTLAKLLPYWMIGFVVLNICILLAWLVYGLAPAGSLFVMWFCMLVFILMSGLFTPVGSMPDWAQCITYLNPLRYFMEIMRMVYLKGSGISDILSRLGILSVFAVLLYGWAIKSYRKQQ